MRIIDLKEVDKVRTNLKSLNYDREDQKNVGENNAP